MPVSACGAGDSVTPPDIRDFTANGTPVDTFTQPLVVPYNGLEGGTEDRPSVLRLEVITSTSGTPVTFRATGAQLVESLVDDPSATGEITVFSAPGPERCVAAVYLFSTKTGPATVSAIGLNELKTEFRVTTVREAARDISLRMSTGTINAGESVEALVDVTDVFGNPVENASVDVSLPPKGTARFPAGTSTFTVLTDTKGRASIQVQTSVDKGTSFTVTAKGDLASCLPFENQYACLADRPVPGFAEASGPQKVKVAVTKPTVTIESPASGSALSTGEMFDIVGATTGVKEGATARLFLGDSPLGASMIKADGSFEFRDVTAQTSGSGDIGYVVIVADLKPSPLDITVKAFTITSFKRVNTGLKFRVAAGAWKAGTIIELTRDGAAVSKIEVTDPGKDVYLFAPEATGFYQVQVSTPRGIVYGLEVQPVLS